MSKESGALSAIAKGVTGYTKGVYNREQARQAAIESKSKLKTQNMQQDLVQSQLDAQNMKNRQLSIQMSRQNTYRALDAYTADFDPKHLNNAIKDDPMLRKLYDNVTSIDKVDPFNDINLIRRSGMDPAGFTEDETKEAASGRYLKVTRPDGSKDIMDMMNVYAGTGYTKHLDKERLTNLILKSKASKTATTPDTRTAMEKNAAAVAQAKTSIAQAKKEGKEPTEKDLQLVEFGKTKKAGVAVGQLREAQTQTEELVKKFGGEDQFFETDFGDKKNFRKAYKHIAAIEKLEKVQFSAKEKTDLNDIRVLISMGDPAKGLTAKETGVWDSTLHSVKKYMSDEVGGTEATSAYAAFRNTVRHALFGSALTEAEIASFRAAFGTLGQKMGPVLQQFKTAITQVKAKLESISRMKNPYSAHVRLGIDDARLDKTLAALDERLATLDNIGTATTKEKPKVTEIEGLKVIPRKQK